MRRWIIEDSTDTLVVYPPRSLTTGAPSSAQVRVGTPAVALPTTWDNATVDSVSASTNAAASEGDTSLSFASDPTATAGRLYLLSLATGQHMTVRVLNSGTTTTIYPPLPMDVPSGSTLTGIAITHALTATETAIPGTGLVKVKCSIGGVEQKWDEQFEIVRASWGEGLDFHELVRRRPEVLDIRHHTDDDLDDTISAAWDEYLLPKLKSQDYIPERIHSLDDLLAPWAAAAVLQCLRSARVSVEERQEAERDFDRAYSLAVQSVRFWYDSPGDDVSAPGNHDETSRRRLRVVR